MPRLNTEMQRIDIHKKILDEIPVGIYLCDTCGNIVYVNDAYANILEIAKDDIIDKKSKKFGLRKMNLIFGELQHIVWIKDGN